MSENEYEKRPAKKAASAGPSEDDRFGAGPVCANAEARIIKYDVVGDRLRITIAKGASHGARDDLPGYIKSGRGMLADFYLEGVRDAVSYALVPITPDQLAGHLYVVINPTSFPSMAVPGSGQLTTRVIAVSVDSDPPRGEGRTKITMPYGTTDGRTRDFTIWSSIATQSFAYLRDPVDFVQAHPEVVLFPNTVSRGSIQRRANGIASTTDVQATAQAGVAGATSRLPHFETVQRAFGRHDISGVQAQVGGPATEASAALGAQAYATGDKVAFASAPDLHTAAHEAAHVIQQQRGAVGFQGLGAADDEHERHADAVADTVVAGQSAEPLLDHLDGSSEVRAVQRKAAAAPRIGERLDDERIEARAIVSGFRAAQHELDADRGARGQQARTALRHLTHCREVAEKYGGNVEEEAITLAADSFDQAFRQFAARANLATVEADQLTRMNASIREQLALAPSSPASYRAVGGSQGGNIAVTLPRVLHLIASRAEAMASHLEMNVDADRYGAIANLSDDLDESIAYASWLFEQLPIEERTTNGPNLDLAADRMHYMLRWIRTRAAYKGMEQRFLKVVRAFDQVLLAGGRVTIESRHAVALTERAHQAGVSERAEFLPALQILNAKLDMWTERHRAAVDRFADLAALDDRDEPSFITELLKSIFVAALGHFGGYLIGAASTKAAAALARAKDVGIPKLPKIDLPAGAQPVMLDINIVPVNRTEEVIRRTVDVSTDAIQSIAGQALQAKTDGQARARAFFVAGMKIDIVDRVAAYRQNVAKMMSANEITPQQIHMLGHLFELVMDGAHDAFLVETAKAWTRYVAQSRLTPKSRSVRSISDMRDYFGERRPDGERVHGTGRAGGAGVLSIKMIVDPPGTRPKIDRDATRLLGMNTEVRNLVIESAGFKLDNVWLPKEINVHTDYGRAIIALDEQNRVRDVSNWSDVVRKVGVESGHKFWSLWGKGIVLK